MVTKLASTQIHIHVRRFQVGKMKPVIKPGTVGQSWDITCPSRSFRSDVYILRFRSFLFHSKMNELSCSGLVGEHCWCETGVSPEGHVKAEGAFCF